MRRPRSVVHSAMLVVMLAAASLAFAPPSTGLGATPDRRVQIPTIGNIATQLGVKVLGTARVDDDFAIGVQFTALLVEPEKLAAFGIKGMHAGARVVAARMSPDRVYIEADEVNPPRRESIRVTLDANGNLVRPPTVEVRVP